MANKHTPGPWTLEAGRNIVTQSGEFYITYGQDKYKNPKFKDFCELDANAHLIAAAPDMLEALNAFLRAPSLGSKGPGSITIEVQDFNLNAARAAIAKAQGN